MFAYVRTVLDRIEKDPLVTSRESALLALRDIGFEDFGALLVQMPLEKDYPKLSSLLPAMASDKTQISWTGQAGLPLLAQSVDFVRSMTQNFVNLTGKRISSSTILDYGCGWGRLLRLMYYFVDQNDVFGVDPWDQSLIECRKCGIDKNLALSHYLPTDLPVGSTKFDLIYAFSVFTHTSKRATQAALAALRRCIATDGLLTITIRPVEYWSLPQSAHLNVSTLIAAHQSQGFAFIPHHREAVDGDITYGDTSMSLDWLDAHAQGWRRVGVDRSMKDAYQIYVFLQPV